MSRSIYKYHPYAYYDFENSAEYVGEPKLKKRTGNRTKNLAVQERDIQHKLDTGQFVPLWIQDRHERQVGERDLDRQIKKELETYKPKTIELKGGKRKVAIKHVRKEKDEFGPAFTPQEKEYLRNLDIEEKKLVKKYMKESQGRKQQVSAHQHNIKHHANEFNLAWVYDPEKGEYYAPNANEPGAYVTEKHAAAKKKQKKPKDYSGQGVHTGVSKKSENKN